MHVLFAKWFSLLNFLTNFIIITVTYSYLCKLPALRLKFLINYANIIELAELCMYIYNPLNEFKLTNL